MTAEVVIRQARPSSYPVTLFCVWGRVGGGNPWFLAGCYANKQIAQVEARALELELDGLHERLLASINMLPNPSAVSQAAMQTRPAFDRGMVA